MDETEMAAAAEALDEIASILDKHSMRKPKDEVDGGELPPADVSIDIKAEGPPIEMEEETPLDIDAVAREEIGEEDAPMSIMSYGVRPKTKGAPQRTAPAPPPVEAPIKRGRGRPKKVL